MFHMPSKRTHLLFVGWQVLCWLSFTPYLAVSVFLCAFYSISLTASPAESILLNSVLKKSLFCFGAVTPLVLSSNPVILRSISLKFFFLFYCSYFCYFENFAIYQQIDHIFYCWFESWAFRFNFLMLTSDIFRLLLMNVSPLYSLSGKVALTAYTSKGKYTLPRGRGNVLGAGRWRYIDQGGHQVTPCQQYLFGVPLSVTVDRC